MLQDIHIVSIIFLIISPNLISILLGWVSLDLVSYMLVIYYQHVRSYGAGMETDIPKQHGTIISIGVP